MSSEIVQIGDGESEHRRQHAAQPKCGRGEQDGGRQTRSPPGIFNHTRHLEQNWLARPCDEERPCSRKQKKSREHVPPWETIRNPTPEGVSAAHSRQDDSDESPPHKEQVAEDRSQQAATQNFQRHHHGTRDERGEEQEPTGMVHWHVLGHAERRGFMNALLRRFSCACVARGVHSNHLVWKLSTKRASACLQVYMNPLCPRRRRRVYCAGPSRRGGNDVCRSVSSEPGMSDWSRAPASPNSASTYCAWTTMRSASRASRKGTSRSMNPASPSSLRKASAKAASILRPNLQGQLTTVK